MENDRVDYISERNQRNGTLTTIKVTSESSVGNEKVPSVCLGANAMDSNVLKSELSGRLPYLALMVNVCLDVTFNSHFCVQPI